MKSIAGLVTIEINVTLLLKMKSKMGVSTPDNNKLTLVSFIILSVLMAFTSLSVDIYLPQMPQMRKELQGNVELTITGFLIGFSIAQLFIGPLSDKYGRRLPLICGLLLFIAGSVGCALSQNIIEIVSWRVVQAVGACAGPLLSRAMVRDMFGRTKAAEVLSTLMLIMALAPVAGPIIGGHLSWQHIFWLLAGVGTLMLFSLLWLPETHPKGKRMKGSIGETFSKYRLLLSNREFMRYTLCVTFFYVGIYAFIAGSPFVYISYFGIQPQMYGWLFGLNIVGLMLVSFGNRFWVHRFRLDKLLQNATAISMIAGIILVILTKSNTGGIFGVIIPVFFFFSMNGIVAATTTAAALDDVPEIAGAAAALLGALQYGSGIFSTFLLSVLPNDSSLTMSWIMAGAGVAAAATILSKPREMIK